MKVSELIEQLQALNRPDDEVMFAYNSRNYWNEVRADSIDVVKPALAQPNEYFGGAYSPVDEDKTSIYEWSEAMKVPVEQRFLEDGGWEKDYDKMRRVIILE